MSVTILDIAKEAGVSKSTVSLVINNRDCVKAETRFKVQEAIKKLSYVPNMAARELATNRKHTIGLVFLTQNDDTRPFEFDAVVETLLYDTMGGIEEALVNTEYTLLTERFNAGGGSLPQMVRSKRVDGVILLGGLFDDPFIAELKKEGLPAVVLGRHHPGIDSVAPDAAFGVKQAVAHLIQTGHRRIAFVNGPISSPNSEKKLDGYRRALEDAVLPYNPELVINASGYTGRDGQEAADSLLSDKILLDALIGGSDGITLGAVRALSRRGLLIPADISVICYENSLLAAYAITALTTIDLNKSRMGQEAARILLSRIEKPKSKYAKLTVPPSLVIRDSVRNR